MRFQPTKKKPKQTHSNTERGLFAYGATDCHGPSGLAMTFVSLLFRGLEPHSTTLRACFVAMSLFEKTKPIFEGKNAKIMKKTGEKE